MSPNNGSSSLTSPPTSRLVSASVRLPSIAEDENVEPRFTLSQRREGAPSAIEIPIIDTVANSLNNLKPRNNSVVSFADDNLKVEEIPCHSPWSAASPIPSEYRVHAGHTPVKTPARPLTPSQNIEDTPTKNNTQINASLAKSDDEDEDPALTGPLSMPELPNQPGEHNFTEEALIRRLEHIAQSPGTEEARPLIFATPTPGLATPEAADGSPIAINRYEQAMARTIDSITNGLHSDPGGIVAPVPTHELPTQTGSAMSPQSGIPLSQITSNEEIEAAVQKDFDEGGIKLKKKPSSNFGAPWGTLGGYGVPRRPS
jgi:hypothetical protein